MVCVDGGVGDADWSVAGAAGAGAGGRVMFIDLTDLAYFIASRAVMLGALAALVAGILLIGWLDRE